PLGMDCCCQRPCCQLSSACHGLASESACVGLSTNCLNSASCQRKRGTMSRDAGVNCQPTSVSRADSASCQLPCNGLGNWPFAPNSTGALGSHCPLTVT